MQTISLEKYVEKAKKSLDKNGVRDLKWLTEHMPEQLNAQQKSLLDTQLHQLKQGTPLAYIMGYVPFYNCKIKVNQSTLIPRPETELLVDMLVQNLSSNTNYKSSSSKDNKRTKGSDLKSSQSSNCLSSQIYMGKDIQVLDLCSGSGCIAVALQKALNCKVDAVEIDSNCCSIIKQNAKLNDTQVEVIQSNMFDKVTKKYDLIVSNPPYISTKSITHLDRSVRDFEPIKALDGGEDGLDFYRIICNQSIHHLKEDGQLALEIGFDQSESIVNLLRKYFKNIEVKRDYSNLTRFVLAKIK